MSSASRTAPQNYEDFARDWTPFIGAVARRCYVAPADVEDFTQEVFVYALEVDALDQYDSRLASFATFLAAYVQKRAFSFRREIRKGYQVNNTWLQRLDEPLGEDEEGTLTDVLPSVDANLTEMVLCSDVYAFDAHLLQTFTTVDKKTGDEVNPLHDVFECVVRECFHQNVISRARIAKELGISQSTLASRLESLSHAAQAWGFVRS